MTTITQQVVDRYLEYRTYLRQYENHVVRGVLEALLRGEEQAIGAIAKAYEQALAKAGGAPLEPWSGYGIGFRRKAIKRTQAALADAFPEARRSLRRALTELAADEQEDFVAMIEDLLPQPVIDERALSTVPERHIANMLDDKFGERLEGSAAKAVEGFRKIEADALARVDRAIVDGVRDGDGMATMIARARRALGAADGVMGHDVARYVRTQVQATANDVAAMLHKENADLIRGEQYVATLDTATCAQCGPLDGTVFSFDDRGRSSVPRPPLHPNCRCFVVPVLKQWDQMGLPASLPRAMRRALDGRPAAKVKWSEWVMAKPGRLERVAGPGRAKLIRAGDVSLADLATREDGVLSIKRLRERMGR